MKSRRGFTLIELLTVIAIIALISAVVLASLNAARSKARDTKRKQDMLQVRTALQAYYADNGSYPLPFGGSVGVLSYGVIATGCGTAPPYNAPGTLNGNNAYIQGLTPKYIATLPFDPQTTMTNCNGYMYASDGKNYKFIDWATPESSVAVGAVFYDPYAMTVVPPAMSFMVCSAGVDANSKNACDNW